MNTPLYRVSFQTNQFKVSGSNLPKKGILGAELRKQLSNSELAPLNTSFDVFSF